MEKNQKIILVVGVVITLALLTIDIYIALIALIFVLSLLMTFHIMGETRSYILIAAELSEDAREVIITNTGTAEAHNINVTIVPFDIEFNIASLKPDETSKFKLESMVKEAKAVITYENITARKFTRTFALTSLGSGDLLKPIFPLFGHR